MSTRDSMAKALVYEAVEVLTARRGIRRRIGGESIRFPARWCRYYEADYETTTFEFLRQSCREGDTVLDLGAHIGLFTVTMARLVGPGGRVLSFEPTPSSREVLRRTVHLNGYDDRVEIRAEAISGRSGVARFFETDNVGSNANSLVATDHHGRELTVPTVSVDDVVSERGFSVSLVKIDVEGAELEVLRGAAQTLSRLRPRLSLALHPDPLRRSGGSLREIWLLLSEATMRVTHRGNPVDESWFSTQEGLFEVQCVPARP